MNSGKTIAGMVFFLAPGGGILGACKADTADTADATDTFRVSWTQPRGFIIDSAEAVEIDAHALDVRTPPSTAGDGGTYMLWATGEGISLPFGFLPEQLPAGEVWPDVVMPETMETGTQLELYTVYRGEADKLVAHLIVDQGLYSDELLSYPITMTRCTSYCDSAECGNCSWGSVCSSGMGYAGVEILSKSQSPDTVCDGQCTDCATDGDHYCWTTNATVWCASASGARTR